MNKMDVLLSYVPIISSSKVIKGKNEHSCGFLVLYKGKKFVVTTSHGILKNSQTGIIFLPSPYTPNVMFFNPSFVTSFKATRFASILKKFNDLFGFNIKVKSENLIIKFREDIDLAFCLIPDSFVAIHNVYGSPCFGQPKKVIDYNNIAAPSNDHIYCFGGISFREYKGGILQFEELVIDDLIYKTTKNGYYTFKTKCNKNLSGCSGSPIFDDLGNLVSIVVKKQRSKIYGINLKQLQVLFDIEGGFIK